MAAGRERLPCQAGGYRAAADAAARLAVQAGTGGVMREAEHRARSRSDLLLEGIRRRYGYDFTHYSHASLKRRLDRARAGCRAHAALPSCSTGLCTMRTASTISCKQMSITVTEMFRDPPFYQAMREKVVPVLKTFRSSRSGMPAARRGEEVYSMAILLHEENFLDRARIYATDFNKHSLDVAQKGIYPAKNMAAYAANYRASGGKTRFQQIITAPATIWPNSRIFLRSRLRFPIIIWSRTACSGR